MPLNGKFSVKKNHLIITSLLMIRRFVHRPGNISDCAKKLTKDARLTEK